MTLEEKNLLIVLAIAAVLAPVVLGAALGWPVWLRLLLAVGLLGVLGRATKSIQRRVRREQANAVPPLPVEEPEASQTSVTDVALPSAEPDYDFRFSATASWRPAAGSTVRHADPGGLAADAIVARARAITATAHPSTVDVVGHQLAAALGTVQRDPSGDVEAWAEQVQLTLPEDDQKRLRQLSDLRKDQDIWEHVRNRERSQRAYFAEDVLKSPGSAVVWWLTRNETDVKGVADLIGPLTHLSAAANGIALPHQHSSGSLDNGQPSPNGRSVASLVGELIGELDPGRDRHALLARYLAQLVETTGKPEEAAEIRRRFDTPVIAEEPTDVPEPDDKPRDRPTPDEEPPLPGERW